MSQPPLPILPKYWTRTEDRSRAVNTIFDKSAADYDWICSVSSFGGGQKYRKDKHQVLLRTGSDESRSKIILHSGSAVFSCARPFSVTIV